MCSLTRECVLLLENAFSYQRMCSLTRECVLLLLLGISSPYRTGNFPNTKRTLSEFRGWRKKIARPVRNFPKNENWITVSRLPRNVAISHTPRSGGAGGLLVSKVLAHTETLMEICILNLEICILNLSSGAHDQHVWPLVMQ